MEAGRSRCRNPVLRPWPDADGEQLPNVKCPALVVMGTLDPDFADPQVDGEAIVAAMPAGSAQWR
jgi:hypothetical protein